jgi:hypothetical protein
MKSFPHSTNTAFEYHLTRSTLDTRSNYDINLNHQVLPYFMKAHKHKCPSTTNKFDKNIDVSETQQRALDKTTKGFRDRLHVHSYNSEQLGSKPTMHMKM